MTQEEQSWLAQVNPIEMLERHLEESLGEEAFGRDPQFLKGFFPYLKGISQYFDGEARGIENLPKEGPCLVVGNHSGGTPTPDSVVLLHHCVQARGVQSPIYMLAFDMLFAVPGMRDVLRRAGVLPAGGDKAQRALEEGAAVIVYPGGEHEVYRPWTERRTVDFKQRTGFIKLAISKRVPVVPVVAHGGHDTLMILSRGDKVGRWLGLDRFRLTAFPVSLGFPFGLVAGWVPSLPLPAKFTHEFLEPMDWSTRYAPDQAEDPEVLQACHDEIVSKMQQTLERLYDERPYPLLSRLSKAIRRIGRASS